MPRPWIKLAGLSWLVLTLQGCDNTPRNQANMSTTNEVKPIQSVTFTCVLEKDHNPPIDPEGEKYFRQARELEEAPGITNWPLVIEYYDKAIEKDHWKAMNNLASLYWTGKRSVLDHPGVEANSAKTLELYLRMVELKIPMGYYNYAIAIGRGSVPNIRPSDAGIFMIKAAESGYPLAQVTLGKHYSFGLPRGQQRNDIAEQYFECAGRQDNVDALLEVASFYKIAKKNKPLALFYYQKATSLGSTIGALHLAESFSETDSYNFGYQPNRNLYTFYDQLYHKLDQDPELRLPNLLKDYPLPRHSTQGYNADNPDVRSE